MFLTFYCIGPFSFYLPTKLLDIGQQQCIYPKDITEQNKEQQRQRQRRHSKGENLEVQNEQIGFFGKVLTCRKYFGKTKKLKTF